MNLVQHNSCTSSRRRLIVLISAALTLAAFDLLVRHFAPLLARYEVDDYGRKPAVLRHTGMPDLVLMGSSRTKYALVPEEFANASGLSAYNLGIAGSKTAEWLAVARTLFADTAPRLVVLGVNASEFRADDLPISAARELWRVEDFVDSLGVDGLSIDVAGAFTRRTAGPAWAAYDCRYEIRMALQEAAARLFPKHAQHARELRERVAAPVPPMGYDHPWLYGRQLRDLQVRLLESPAAVDAASVPAFDAGAAAFVRFEQLLEWLKSRGIGVAVVYLPNSPRTEARWSGVEPLFIDEISTRCRRYGVQFYPLPAHELPRTNADYLEEVHVGLPLARRISRRTAGLLVASGIMPARLPRVAGVSAGEGSP
jgi:hypothetical protein